MLRIIICLSLYQLVLSSNLCLTPPAFPDIRQFLKTPESMAIVQRLSDYNSEKNCSCAFEEGLQEANKYRDSADCDTPYFRCPVQTTVVTFQPTTMMYEDTTLVTDEMEYIESEEPIEEPVTSIPAKSPIVPTSRSSTSRSTSGSSTTGSTPTTPTPTKTTSKSTKTTKATSNGNNINKPSLKPTSEPVVQESGTNTTAVMGAVIACVLVVVIIVGILLACRKHMPACPGPPAKVHKPHWLKQTTSQAPLMKSTSQKDIYDGSGNGEPVLLSPGKAEEGGIFFLDNTDSDFHYNTLKAMAHNHALHHGFGESSTDKTLPRNTLKKQKKKKSARKNSESKFVVTGTPVRQDSNGATKTSDYGSMNGNSIEYPDENDNHRRYSMTSKDSIDTEATFLSRDNTVVGGPDDDLVSNDNIDLFDHDENAYVNMAFDKNGEVTPPPHTSTPEEERRSTQLETVADVHTFTPPPPSQFMDSEPDLVKSPAVAVVIPTVRNSNHNSLESLTDVGQNEAPTPNTLSSDNTNSGMNEIQYMTYDKPKKLDPSRFSFLQEPYNTLTKPPIFQNGDIKNKNGPFIPVSQTNGVPNGGFVHNDNSAQDQDNPSTKYGDTRL